MPPKRDRTDSTSSTDESTSSRRTSHARQNSHAPVNPSNLREVHVPSEKLEMDICGLGDPGTTVAQASPDMCRSSFGPSNMYSGLDQGSPGATHPALSEFSVGQQRGGT